MPANSQRIRRSSSLATRSLLAAPRVGSGRTQADPGHDRAQNSSGSSSQANGTRPAMNGRGPGATWQGVSEPRKSVYPKG